MRFLAFLLGWWVYRPYSLLVAAILRMRGVQVGRNFYMLGTPYLKIGGKAGDISIGDNVTINSDIDIRNRENGRIVIEDGVTFDTGYRLVAANDSTLLVRSGAVLACYYIVNCGIGIEIGKDCRIADFCCLQDSDYGLLRSLPLKTQRYTYGKTVIGSEVWLGAHVSVLKSVTVEQGAIVGANAVVTKDLSAFSINGGVPARQISERPA